MRKQYHFKNTGTDILIWDVHKLVERSADFPVKDIPLAAIKELKENYWYQFAGDVPTCQSIADHFILMQEADLKYPIILNADGSVMDGMHRVCKAYALGHKNYQSGSI